MEYNQVEMSLAAKITTPFPSVAEIAERAGVPPSRASEIVQLAEGISLRSSGALGRPAVRRKPAKQSTGVGKRAARAIRFKKK